MWKRDHCQEQSGVVGYKGSHGGMGKIEGNKYGGGGK